MGKGWQEFFDAADADFFCLQETKLQEGQINLDLPGYHQYWNYAEKKGYSGTAIFAKQEPISVRYGVGIPELDTEGRMITLELPEFYFNLVYTPNAGDGLRRLSERQVWDVKYAEYLKSLDADKPVIACGDYNVAHEEIDLAHPANNHMSAGFTDEERAGFTNLLGCGFVDTFRHVHGNIPNVYSWWAQRIKPSKINNSGWRIDYFLVSERIKDKVVRSEMMDSGARQDHAPILLEVEM
jgi:exodeoxyribonuclease-3